MKIEQLKEKFEIDVGAPMPVLLSNEHNVYLVFYIDSAPQHWLEDAKTLVAADIPVVILMAYAFDDRTFSGSAARDFVSRFFAPSVGVDEDPRGSRSARLPRGSWRSHAKARSVSARRLC